MASDALNMKQEVVSLCDQVARYGFRLDNIRLSSVAKFTIAGPKRAQSK